MRIYFCGQSIKQLFVLSLEVALVLVTIFWILDSFFVIVCQGLVDPDRLNETCLSYGPRRLTSSLVQLEAEELQTLAETSPSYLVIFYSKPRSHTYKTLFARLQLHLHASLPVLILLYSKF